MTDDFLDDELGLAPEPLIPDPIAVPTTADALAEYASRGPLAAALVAEVLQANADRAAVVAAREKFAEDEQTALAADDIPAAVLGTSLQEEFVDALRFADTEKFDAQLAAVYRAGAAPTSEGGQNWGPDGPLPALDATEQALLARWRSELTTDPSTILAQVQAAREVRMTEVLKANPGLAFQQGLEFDPYAKKYVQGAPAISAADLSPDEWVAVQAAARGEPFAIPAGHDAASFRKRAAPFLGAAR